MWSIQSVKNTRTLLPSLKVFWEVSDRTQWQMPHFWALARLVKRLPVGLVLLGVIASTQAYAGLKELSVTVKQYQSSGYYPLITDNGLAGRKLDKELNLNIKTSLLTYGFLDAKIHSMTDQSDNARGQFRLVGLNLKTGVKLSAPISVYYEHFSQHMLDHKLPSGRFPLQDAVGVDIILYSAHPSRGLVP